MISLIGVLIVAIIVLWAIGKLLPLLSLPEPIGTVVYVIVIVAVVLWLVQALGLWSGPLLR